jgi:hypothetical protein
MPTAVGAPASCPSCYDAGNKPFGAHYEEMAAQHTDIIRHLRIVLVRSSILRLRCPRCRRVFAVDMYLD